MYLVVSGDHDDTDSSIAALFNHGLDFHTWGIQHTNDTNEGEVDFVTDELVGVFEVHVGGADWAVGGGEGKTPVSKKISF